MKCLNINPVHAEYMDNLREARAEALEYLRSVVKGTGTATDLRVQAAKAMLSFEPIFYKLTNRENTSEF